MSEIYTGSMSSSEQAQVRLGGMALRNGVLVQGPDHWAAAVRTPEGEIRMASGRKPELPAPALSVPGLRGVLRVAEAIYLLPLVRRRLPEARLPMEGATTSGALAASLVLTRVLRAGRVRPLTAEVAGAGISLLPALASLRSSQLARYHGAEHKAIGGYERGTDAEEQSTEHERCGSHLVGPLVVTSIAGGVLARAFPKPFRPFARVLAAIAAAGASVELFSWMVRHEEHPLARALARPGHELQQRVLTAEPSADQLDVAEAALAACLALEAPASA